MKKRHVLAVIPILLLLLTTIPVCGQANPDASISTGLLDTLKQQTDHQIQIAYHADTGQVRFIGTDQAHPIPQPAPLVGDATPETAARQFLSAYGTLFGVTDQAQGLAVMKTQEADGNRSFVRFQQVSANIPVLGGELIVQMDGKRDILSVNGEVLPDLRVDSVPTLAAGDAARLAVGQIAKDYAQPSDTLQATEPELWIYDPVLLDAPGPRVTSLVWRVEVQATDLLPIKELVLVDAHRGGVVLHFSEIDTAKYRKIYDNQNNTSYGLPGNGPVRVEGQGATGIGDADKAYDYAGDVYDFYKNTHNRDSVDGAGMQLISTVRYCKTGVTCPYENAFWNGEQMVYGQGYSSADDVVAHEMTHGVTDHESHLFYYMQSGAINESLSDIWGEFIDLSNGKGTDTTAVRWLMGEDVPGGAIRSMSNPPAYNDPDKITSANYSCDLQDKDNGGVHTNSGVSNKAAYLMTDGGTFNGKTVTGLGITKVAKIFYEVQTHLFTSASDFQDLYNGLQQACTNLVGTNGITAADCQQVKNAVDATEMNQQPTQCPANEAPLCPTGQTATRLFFDNLENTASGNWSKGTISGSQVWFYPQNPNAYTGFDATYATSGRYNFFGDDPDSSTDSFIAMTKNIALPAGKSPYLRFNHSYGFETSSGGTMYDGGVIEYSTDSGSSWHDAGSLITDNGYRGTLDSGNPLGARQAFGSKSNGYISSRLGLSTLAGQNIRFRFRIGTDSSGYSWGWFLDDINIYTCAAVVTAPDVSINKRLASSNPRPGDPISFILTVANLGNAAASQIVITDLVPSQVANLSYSSTLPVTQGGGAAYTWNLASLAAGASGTITVNGKLSTGLPANFRLVNTATVTAPNDSNPSNNSGSAIVGGAKVYLPVMVREWPPFPATPVLNPINNPSGAASYSVTWASAARATGYILRESFNDPSFGSATQVYSGGDLAWAASGKAVGAYYYSVKATSATGASGWSNVQSVVVTPPPLPTQLAPIADATVAQAAPTLNMGDTDDMIVGYEHCGYGNGVWRSMLKFDLSAIPASKAITSAKLRVYFIEACDIGSRTHTVRTSRITGNWTELGVTWNNQPGVGTQYGTAQVTSGTWQWIEFDVTALVRGWINGSIPNQGVMLRGPEASDNSSASLGFLTRDYSDAAERPYLSIAYAGQAAAEPGLPASGPALPRDCSRSAAQRLWSEGLAAPGFSAARACAAQ